MGQVTLVPLRACSLHRLGCVLSCLPPSCPCRLLMPRLPGPAAARWTNLCTWHGLQRQKRRRLTLLLLPPATPARHQQRQQQPSPPLSSSLPARSAHGAAAQLPPSLIARGAGNECWHARMSWARAAWSAPPTFIWPAPTARARCAAARWHVCCASRAQVGAAAAARPMCWQLGWWV